MHTHVLLWIDAVFGGAETISEWLSVVNRTSNLAFWVFLAFGDLVGSGFEREIISNVEKSFRTRLDYEIWAWGRILRGLDHVSGFSFYLK